MHQFSCVLSLRIAIPLVNLNSIASETFFIIYLRFRLCRCFDNSFYSACVICSVTAFVLFWRCFKVTTTIRLPAFSAFTLRGHSEVYPLSGSPGPDAFPDGRPLSHVRFHLPPAAERDSTEVTRLASLGLSSTLLAPWAF